MGGGARRPILILGGRAEEPERPRTSGTIFFAGRTARWLPTVGFVLVFQCAKWTSFRSRSAHTTEGNCKLLVFHRFFFVRYNYSTT